MPLTSVAVHVLFLALAGIIGSKFYRKLRGGQLEPWGVAFEVLIFALSSYLTVIVLSQTVGLAIDRVRTTTAAGSPAATRPAVVTPGQRWSDLGLMAALTDEKATLSWPLVLGGCAASVVLALGLSLVHNHRLVNRIGQRLGVSDRLADEDLWELFHSSTRQAWVVVRDLENKLAYYGRVQMYSDAAGDRELILTDVDVFDGDSAEFRYSAPVIYVCQARDKLVVEVSKPDGRPSSQAADQTAGTTGQPAGGKAESAG